MTKNLFDRSGDIYFAQVRMGEEFNWKGELYQKANWSVAIPISFIGPEKTFQFDEVVTLNRA